MERYDPRTIEPRWQQRWESERAFETPNPERPPHGDLPRSYVLEMLPYPSGELHMGHVKNYTMGDVLCHQRRRAGLAVLHPMGYDAFGLPAENAAIREGGHPREVTERNIVAIRRQMKRMGWSIDWSRELSTHEPAYYRWTQWIFLQLWERGLAYEGLAGQVVPGRPDGARERAGHRRPCERCGSLVESRTLEQWYFRITAYGSTARRHGAARGLARARAAARSATGWGSAHGAQVRFHQPELEVDLPVFTTRPDTLYGATFFVVAPEHPLVPQLVAGSDREEEVLAYVRTARLRSPRRSAHRTRPRPVSSPARRRQPRYRRGDSGLDRRLCAERYGTGAIMAVPAHDSATSSSRASSTCRSCWLPARRRREASEATRDAAHARGYDRQFRPTRRVAQRARRYSALHRVRGEKGVGEARITYRLHDWLISRQRYWGRRSRWSTARRTAWCRCPRSSCR